MASRITIPAAEFELGESDDQLAHAAHVLAVLAAVLGVPRARRVAEVENGEAVVLGVGAEDVDDLPGELRVGRRDHEVPAQEAQVHVGKVQQGPRRLLPARELPFLDEADRQEPADAGRLVAVQGVGRGRDRQRRARHDECGGPGSHGTGASLMRTAAAVRWPACCSSSWRR
jgi:hypothetical protein